MLCPECGEVLAAGPLDARRAGDDAPKPFAWLRGWFRRKARDDAGRR
jgi:hypothetical protein